MYPYNGVSIHARSLQIVRNTGRAVLYSQCIPTGICHVLLGAFFVWRGVQATVYLIMGKVWTI